MTNVKICGLTNVEDALTATEAGADLLGFIFYEPSPRYVAPERVRGIVSAVKEKVGSQEYGVESRGIRAEEMRSRGAEGRQMEIRSERNRVMCVGVFVNGSIETIREIMTFCRLDAVQLHGDEPPEMVAAFDGLAYKALRPQSVVEAQSLVARYVASREQRVGSKGAEGQWSGGDEEKRGRGVGKAQSTHHSSFPQLPTLLLDAYHPTLYGGTGRVTDWSIAATIAAQTPLMLAGSLTPDNVAEAIEAVQPWGVDVSSGVEKSKGQKDHEKLRRFIQNVRLTRRSE